MKDKIVDKIKKLLLKANSTDSPAEAESLFAKASKLMIRLKISQADIEQEMDENFVKINEVEYSKILMEGKWEPSLALAIADYQDCRAVLNSREKRITFYGEENDVSMAKYFFEQARNTFRTLSRSGYRSHKSSIMLQNPGIPIETLEKTKKISYSDTFIRSFLHGCVNGLTGKLRSLKEEMLKQEATEEYGLMVANQVFVIENYISTNIKTKKTKLPTAQGDIGAFLKGEKAGSKHNLSVGVETSSNKQDKVLRL